MEKVSKEDFEKAKYIRVPKEKDDMSEFQIENMLKEMEDPLKAQKRLAVQIKLFLEKRIKKEMSGDKQILTDTTRRWIETYNNILEKLQKSIHGDKSLNVHLHKVSHSDIAAQIRNSYKD